MTVEKEKPWEVVLQNNTPDLPEKLHRVLMEAQGNVQIDNSIIPGALHLSGEGEAGLRSILIALHVDWGMKVIKNEDFPKEFFPEYVFWFKAETDWESDDD